MKLGPIGWLLYVFYRGRMWAFTVQRLLTNRDVRRKWLGGNSVAAVRVPSSGEFSPVEVLAICHELGVDPELVFEEQRQREEDKLCPRK